MDGDLLRQAMRRVPSPVTVVTVAGPEGPRGITIGSFTSVSLDPPLVSFNVQHGAQIHEALIEADQFLVQVLSDAQAHLSEHFALPGRTSAEQFADVPHRLTPDGLPILADTVTRFRARPHAVHPAGDHSLILAEVLAVEENLEDVAPLVYYDRGYRSVGGETVLARTVPPVNRASSETP